MAISRKATGRSSEPCSTIHVKVVPGAKRDRVAGKYGDGIKVQVSAPPEGGKANDAVVQVIADALGIKVAQVQIVRGHGQPRKVVSVAGIEQVKLNAWITGLTAG